MGHDKIMNLWVFSVLLTQKVIQKLFGVSLPICISNLKVPSNLCYIISTKRALYLIKNGKLYSLFAGTVYGATIKDERVIFYNESNTKGSILSLCEDFKIQKIHTLLKNLPSGIHQVDFIGEHLYCINTYNNSILVYDQYMNFVQEIFPNGKLSNGRSSTNYNHYNSIFKYNNTIYLVAHNETVKTKRYSEIWKSFDNFENVNIEITNASCAHNIYKDNECRLICNSLEGELLNNNRVVFKCDSFLRGLSVSHDQIVVGGSEYSKRRYRNLLGGFLYFLNKDFNYIMTIQIPGMVQDVCRLDCSDHTLSNCNVK